MDAIDARIIDMLKDNARASLKEISARVCLSQPATGERLRKLEKSGAIRGYTVLLDGEAFDRDFCCFCLVNLEAEGARKDAPFLEFVAGHPDVLECHRIVGAYEYLLKIATQSPKTLEVLLQSIRDTFGVARTTTYPVLSTSKYSPSFL